MLLANYTLHTYSCFSLYSRQVGCPIDTMFIQHQQERFCCHFGLTRLIVWNSYCRFQFVCLSHSYNICVSQIIVFVHVTFRWLKFSIPICSQNNWIMNNIISSLKSRKIWCFYYSVLFLSLDIFISKMHDYLKEHKIYDFVKVWSFCTLVFIEIQVECISKCYVLDCSMYFTFMFSLIGSAQFVVKIHGS